MVHTHRKLAQTAVATALVLSATAAPGAAAQPVDLRTPDARDASASMHRVIDLRSPDARDASASMHRVIDLRSPDARDAGEARTIVVPTRGGTTKVQTANPSGFDWGDAATGAGVVLTVLLAATGGMIAVRRIRRPHAAAAPKA